MISVSKVSFVVPTLNRGRYVVRAVQSCLDAARRVGVGVEVIVLDSRSDDGSWELLSKEFDDFEQVVLIQNERGLGPTRSWLDAAEFVTGDYVTFVWSDDYIFDHFLENLLPPLAAGNHLAIANSIVRDIDVDTPVAEGKAGHVMVPVEDVVLGYYGLSRRSRKTRAPVSPACSLFSREAFDAWRLAVASDCQADPLRQNLHWKRAIGPDLMLYLLAIDRQGNTVPVITMPVAQFSSHESSISLSSNKWNMVAGYWLALSWFLRLHLRRDLADPNTIVRLYAKTILQGLMLAWNAPADIISAGTKGARTATMKEVHAIFASASSRGVGKMSLLRAATGVIWGKLVGRGRGHPDQIALDGAESSE